MLKLILYVYVQWQSKDIWLLKFVRKHQIDNLGTSNEEYILWFQNTS